LQQSFSTSLDKVDAGHYFARQAFYRLRGAGCQHYIARVERPFASGLDISDERPPTRRG
jgi:hypothetical protein